MLLKLVLTLLVLCASPVWAVSSPASIDVLGHGAALFQKSNVEPYSLMIPNLKEARNQEIGNCWYQAHVRASEYIYKKVTGESLSLSPTYFSANYMRMKALEALENPNLSTDFITDGSWGGPNEIQMRFGLTPTIPSLTPTRVMGLKSDLIKTVENFRAKNGSSLAEYQERVNALVDKAGASPQRIFRRGGQEYTPQTFSKIFPFNKLKWVVVQVGDRHKYLPDLPMISSYEEVNDVAMKFLGQMMSLSMDKVADKDNLGYLIQIDSQRPLNESSVVPSAMTTDYFGFLLKYKKSLELMIHDSLAQGLPVMTTLWFDTYEDKNGTTRLYIEDGQEIPEFSWSMDDHGVIIVGMKRSKDGQVTLYLQNSWGTNSTSAKGIVTVSLEDFAKLVNRLTFPILIQ